jgi:hypothetical protein
MLGICGQYEGEGPNTTGLIPLVPDTNAAPLGGTNAAQTPQTVADTAKKAQGRVQNVAITRRRQLRTSDESARAAALINYSGGNQVLTNGSRGLYITTGGTLVLLLVEDPAATPQTYSGLVAGTVYPFCVAQIIQSGSTAAGIVLY